MLNLAGVGDPCARGSIISSIRGTSQLASATLTEGGKGGARVLQGFEYLFHLRSGIFLDWVRPKANTLRAYT